MRVLKAMCCAAALAAILAPGTARADQWDKLTYLTFSGPVQLPGITLPAGTYMFRLADTNSDRHVIQVFDKNRTKIYGTILTVPDKRLEPTGKNVVMFTETAKGAPAAVKAWFYPGDTYGDEFVYPRSQAMKIAKATHQPVLATADASMNGSNDQKTGSLKSAEVAHIDENGNKVDDNASDKAAKADKDANKQMASAQDTNDRDRDAAMNSNGDMNHAGNRAARRNNRNAVGTSGQANDDNANGRHNRRHLPATASSLALFELLSGLSLAGALGLRRARHAFNR